MSLVTSSDFVGTRARFQRLRDSKIFNGWIVTFFGNRLEVSTGADATLKPGDEFRFEGFGDHISVVFNTKLETITPGTDQTLGKSVLLLSVASPMRYADSPESVRYRIQELKAQVEHGGKTVKGSAIDASPTGVGLSCDTEIPLKCEVKVTVVTPLGAITAKAECRHCDADPDRPGKFRAGFSFLELGRVDKPKWDRFVRELT